MKRFSWLLVGSAFFLGGKMAAQDPGEGPALGFDRITQAQITGGGLTLREIRRKGLEIFSTPFNQYDGYGDGTFDPLDPDHTSPGNRPMLQDNGTFTRINGLDSQSCLECHSVVSNATVPPVLGVGGVGGISATAMPGATHIDIDDEEGNGFAAYDGRLINPPFVFGSGGVELVAKEMTRDLQAIQANAFANPDLALPLVTKGVDFGTIVYDSRSGVLDTSNVQGVDEDLCVKPFGRKGDRASIRQFDIAALQFHQGMQPVEVVGEGIDDDRDGVADEILVGELSALHVFAVASDRPVRTRPDASARRGFELFVGIGCAACHVPSIETEGRVLPLAYPEVLSDPWANVFHGLELTVARPGFRRAGSGVRVEMFSDLKRHDMGDELAESTGDPLDRLFITPRLWGVADTAPYLHDGRALSLTEAIRLHGGEAAAASRAFQGLSGRDRTDLLGFLRTLRTPADPNADILVEDPRSLQRVAAGPLPGSR